MVFSSTSRYSKTAEKNFLLILGALFVFLSFIVIKPILYVIILSSILAYFLYPLYVGFSSRFNSKQFSSIITLVCATMGFFLPLFFLLYYMIANLSILAFDYREYITNPEQLSEEIIEFLYLATQSEVVKTFDFTSMVSGVLQSVDEFVLEFASSVFVYALYFFIILFITHYLLIYSNEIFKGVNEYLPLTLRKQNEIVRNVSRNITVLFKGYFLTGLIQTGVACVGYIILDIFYGFPNLLIIIFLTMIVSLIPYLGPPLVWMPVCIYYFIIGEPQAGTLLFVYGITVVSMIDNFIRPILMSDKDTIPPPLVFVGFVGGTLAFGVLGLIIGPIIISITAILLRYLKEYYELPKEE